MFVNKSRRNRKKTKKYRKKVTMKKYGGEVIGYGAQGCVIDSLHCPNFSNFVAKIMVRNNHDNIYEKIKKIDPLGKRFALYFSHKDCPIKYYEDNQDVKLCESRIGKVREVFFTKKLEDLPKRLSKVQYRFLRDSLDLLKREKISHNDLPGNVMLDPESGLPIIIDWDNATFISDEETVEFDRAAFLSHFRT
jgi:thiamine kinase-like enzyme